MRNVIICCVLSWFIVLPRLGFSEEAIDIGSLLEKRSKQYTLANYKRIWIISPPRTGSVLVFNVFRTLFEDVNNIRENGFESTRTIVVKTHQMPIDYFHPEDIMIFVMRNPVDAIYSHTRILNDYNYLIPHHMSYFTHLETLLKRNVNMVILRYEDFVNDLRYLLEKIEHEFSMTIEESDKELIMKALSKENVLNYISKFKNFDHFDPGTSLHGKHIDTNDPKRNDVLLKKRDIAQRLASYRHKFKKWNY